MNTNFEKLLLVTEEERDRMRQKRIREFNPKVRTLAFLEEEMEQILNDNKLDSEHKYKLFQMAQNRYEMLQSTEKTIALPNITQSSEATSTIAAPSKEPVIVSKDAERQKHYESNIAAIHNYLKAHKSVIDADDDFNLCLNGKPTSDKFSNVVRYLASARHSKFPSSLPDLLATLKGINFPASMIVNKKAKTMYDNVQQGYGRIATNSVKTNALHSVLYIPCPPGNRPRILHVY